VNPPSSCCTISACSSTPLPCSSSPVQVELEPIAETLCTRVTWRDELGTWRVRWGVWRMKYLTPSGLYRIGKPDAGSPVLVTANYKLTVDTVRKELAGLDVWLLVLDTKGINVWCAASKGTFGTDEVVRRVQSTNLKDLVNHRNLILPQLSATGVAAHEVKRATGFTVHYGPVRAADIREYLVAGLKATPGMRRVTFKWNERIVLSPVEVVNESKNMLLIFAALALLNMVHDHRLTAHVFTDFVPFAAAFLAGGVLVPLFLPLIPFRYFALKGAAVGALVAALLLACLPMGRLEAAGVTFLVIAIPSYMAMMFTGCTTFTTLAGAQLEVRRALPPILASLVIGTILRITAAFV